MINRQKNFQQYLETIMKEVSELQLVELVLSEINKNYDIVSKFSGVESEIYKICSTISLYNKDIIDKVKDKIDIIISIEEFLKLHTNLLNEFKTYKSDVELLKKTSVNIKDYEERINGLLNFSKIIEDLIKEINNVNTKYINRNNKDLILGNITKGVNNLKANVEYATLPNANICIKNYRNQINSLSDAFTEEKNKLIDLHITIIKDKNLWKEDSATIENEIEHILNNFEKSINGLKYCQDLYIRMKNKARKTNDIIIIKEKYKWLARNKYRHEIEYIINNKISHSEAKAIIEEVREGRGLLTKLYELLVY